MVCATMNTGEVDLGGPMLFSSYRTEGFYDEMFEADGRVVDAAGQDWDETWGHTREGHTRKS